MPNPEHHYQHSSPQAHCLTTADGRLAVDWVGRVEAFEEDLGALVDLLNARPGVPRLLHPDELDPPLARLNHNAGDCNEADREGEDADGRAQLGAAGGGGGQGSGEGGRSGNVTVRIAIKESDSGGGDDDEDSIDFGDELASSRRLRFFSSTPIFGGKNLLPEKWAPRSGTLNPCDKNSMFRGRHAHCYAALSRFFQEDMRLLHDTPG